MKIEINPEMTKGDIKKLLEEKRIEKCYIPLFLKHHQEMNNKIKNIKAKKLETKEEKLLIENEIKKSIGQHNRSVDKKFKKKIREDMIREGFNEESIHYITEDNE